MLTTPSRIFKTAWQQMGRHIWHTMAAVAVMSLTFLVISLFVLAALGSNVVLDFFEKQPQMIVFFTDSATTQRVQEIEQALTVTGKVASTHYTSKDEALAFYKQQTSNDPVLTENLSANILPASLEVSPKKLSDINQLAGVVKQSKYQQFVDSVSYPRDLTERLSAFTSTGRLVGLGLIFFLILISFLIILVTIGLNISSFKDEIEVMRLVGATNWYIRGPFLVEGVLYGVFGSVLAVGLVYATLPWIAPRLQSWFNGIAIFPIPVVPVFGGMLVTEMVLGILLGVIGSMVAMRRSLKV